MDFFPVESVSFNQRGKVAWECAVLNIFFSENKINNSSIFTAKSWSLNA